VEDRNLGRNSLRQGEGTGDDVSRRGWKGISERQTIRGRRSGEMERLQSAIKIYAYKKIAGECGKEKKRSYIAKRACSEGGEILAALRIEDGQITQDRRGGW